MDIIDSSAYKVLKKLNKNSDSRCLTNNEQYWISYLTNRKLTKTSFDKSTPNLSIGIEIISDRGKSFIKDHKHNTIKKLLIVCIPSLIGLAGVLIALLKQ